MEEAARLERRAMEAQTPKRLRPEPPVIHNGLTEQEKHERIIAFMFVPIDVQSACNHVTHLLLPGRIKHQMMKTRTKTKRTMMVTTPWSSKDRREAANTSTRMT